MKLRIPGSPLVAMFCCSLGQVATSLAVLGALARLHANGLSPGAGLAPAFCAGGSLAGAVSLPWLRRHLPVKQLAWSAVYACAAFVTVMWALQGRVPAWELAAMSGAAASAAYVVLNFCLSTSVFRIDASMRNGAAIRQVSLPFLSAQAVGPLLAGSLLDAFGLSGIAVLITIAFIVTAMCVIDGDLDRRISDPQVAISGLHWFSGPAGVALSMAVIVAFALNWYFSATLSYFSRTPIPASLLGAATSGVQVAAVLGAGCVHTRLATRHSPVVQLVLASMVVLPCLLVAHAVLGPKEWYATGAMLVIIGALSGSANAFIAIIKFSSVRACQFSYFQRRLTVAVPCATFAGAFAGTSSFGRLGWANSLIGCAATCVLLGLRPAMAIKAKE